MRAFEALRDFRPLVEQLENAHVNRVNLPPQFL